MAFVSCDTGEGEWLKFKGAGALEEALLAWCYANQVNVPNGSGLPRDVLPEDVKLTIDQVKVVQNSRRLQI